MKKIGVSELAEVATCERRVFLKARYGERTNKSREVARSKGILVHDAAYRQRHPEVSKQVRTPAGDKRCFVATCLYGENGSETVALRAFRDSTLRQSSLGRASIWLYYRTSPTLVRAMELQPWLKRPVDAIVRIVLKAIAKP